MNPSKPVHLILQSILLIASLLSITSAMAQHHETHFLTGRMTLNLQNPTGDRHLEGFIWYPTLDSSDPVWAHGNQAAVWEPIAVHLDAPPIEATFPVLVLSHGLFGTAHNQAWLAEALVAEGYIVVAIHHPGTSHFFRDPHHRRELWQRAQDISRVIDFITSDFTYADRIRQDEIYMAGHSLGGFTAMLLAGARYNTDTFNHFCADKPEELVCSLFTEWGVAKSTADIHKMEQDWSDGRIQAFAIFDLGGSQSFSPASLAAIDIPLLVYGAPAGLMRLNLDIESRYLVNQLTQNTAIYHEPVQLGHFDFLGICTENALQVLEESEPDDLYICENGRDPRRDMQKMIVEQLLAFFNTLN